MYLGPVFIGTVAGYGHAAFALGITGSIWTALLTLVLVGTGVTFALLVRLAILTGPPPDRTDGPRRATRVTLRGRSVPVGIRLRQPVT